MIDGTFEKGQMAGVWTRKEIGKDKGKLLGTGTFRSGNAIWKSFRSTN